MAFLKLSALALLALRVASVFAVDAEVSPDIPLGYAHTSPHVSSVNLVLFLIISDNLLF